MHIFLTHLVHFNTFFKVKSEFSFDAQFALISIIPIDQENN